MTFKQRTVSGVKWTGFSAITVSSLQLLQLAFLGRLLAPADFGLMAMVTVAIGFAQLFADMGISNAIIYMQDATPEELSSLYWLNIFSGFVIFLLIWFLSPYASIFFNETRLVNLYRITGAVFIIIPFGQQFQMLLQKELKFNILAEIEIFSSLISTFVTISTAFAGEGVYSLVWGQIVGASCMTLSLVSAGRKKWRPAFRFRIADINRYISFGLYQLGERSINYLSRNLDNILIGRLLGAVNLGFYSVAYQLMIRPMRILNPVITKVAFPVFSKIQYDDKRLRDGYLQIIEVIAFMSMPIYFGMYAVSDTFIPLFLGHAWVNAIPIFNVLVVLGMFYSLGNPVGSLLLAKGRADLGFWFNAFIITVSVPAMIIGSWWGVMGIAWILVLVTAFIFFPCGFVLRYLVVKLKPFEYIQKFIGFVLIAFTMAIIIRLLGRHLIIDSSILRLCLLVLAGIIFYTVSVWFFKKNFLRKTMALIRS